MLIVIKYGNNFKIIIFCRLFIIFLLLILIGLVEYICINLLLIELEYLNSRFDLGIVFIYACFPLLFFYLLYLFFKQFSFFVYTDTYLYSLYLRPFKSNETIRNIEKKLKNRIPRILAIGNPNTFFEKTIGKTLYLPSVNWQKWINYYISRAKYVILIVNDSDGVIWEMFEHSHQIEKFVFIVYKKDVLVDIINKYEKEISKNIILKKCILELVETTNKEKFIFSIIDDKCKISSISDINKHIKKLNKNHNKREESKDAKILDRLRIARWFVEKNSYNIIDKTISIIEPIIIPIIFFFNNIWLYIIFYAFLVVCGCIGFIYTIDSMTIAQRLFYGIFIALGFLTLGCTIKNNIK